MAFFFITVSWWLLENEFDLLAGLVLPWTSIKPQLGGLLILGVLLWMLRRRRWRFLFSFAAASAVLCTIGWILVPWWPLDIWRLMQTVPPPTEYYPWIGTTWSLLLKTVGVSGSLYWLLYGSVALISIVLIIGVALSQRSSIGELYSVALISVFFVAPYARHYDFPILLIPILLLANERLPCVAGTALLLSLVLLPYVQFVILFQMKEVYGPYFKYHGELSFFWIPVLIAMLWLVTSKRKSVFSLRPAL
jgi:hypothetical protein